jgi:hypothetical protein
MPLISINPHRIQQSEKKASVRYRPLQTNGCRYRSLLCGLVILLVSGILAAAGEAGETPLIPLGISDGQTLRVVALNLGTNRTVKVTVKFLDADGNLLLQSPSTSIASGKMTSFDYPRPSTNGETGRIQIRPVVITTERLSAGCIHITMEVFNDEDGKTTLLWDGPSIL